jgi:superfamily II DNA or RNA helicase
MILRPYQLDLACEVIAVHECMTRKVLAVLPTGGGKSTIIGFAALHDTGNIWVIAHRQELIRQLSGTLTRFDLPHGIVKSGYPFDPTQRIQVASIQTLVKRHHMLPEPAMIIVDEAHHATSKSYITVTDSYPKSRVLGVTATPCRLNGQGLGEVFEHMVLGPTTKWLTEQGFLAPAKYYSPPPVVDTSTLPVQAGDYAKKQSDELMDKPAVTGDAVSHYRDLCDGQPMIVFCTSVSHAKNVAEEYCAAGYRAVSVDGKMKDEDRADAITGLASGKYQIVTSCELIGEGLDVPVCSAIPRTPPPDARSCASPHGRKDRLHSRPRRQRAKPRHGDDRTPVDARRESQDKESSSCGTQDMHVLLRRPRTILDLPELRF